MTKSFKEAYNTALSFISNDYYTKTNKINEDSDGGMTSSSFGDGIDSTSTAFSGDNYAKDDARIPYGIYGGAITRYGMKKSKSRKKRRKK